MQKLLPVLHFYLKFYVTVYIANILLTVFFGKTSILDDYWHIEDASRRMLINTAVETLVVLPLAWYFDKRDERLKQKRLDDEAAGRQSWFEKSVR